MWTIGVSLGLRISDLLSLKFGHLIDIDKKTIKPRIQIYEQKMGKLNNCLVTESVKLALGRYLESIKYTFDLDGYLFTSKKTKGKMYEECGWRILSSAGKALKLPLVIGSHTMRKSFANIAACVDKSCIDMNVHDWRFGQFMSNFLSFASYKTKRDIFFIEDEEMENLLVDFFETKREM